jgi:hypothetical protein
MKKCPVCGRKVVSKRRDAIYCRNPRCRKEAFLARKEQAATEPLPKGANKASVVVSFPDGSRWLMELTPLQPTTQTQLPTLTQVASLTPIQTDGSAEVKMAAIDWSPATTGSGLEPIQAASTDEKMDVVVSERASSSAAMPEATEVDQNRSEPIQVIVAEDAISSDLPADSTVEAAEITSPVPASTESAESAAVEVPTEIRPESREPALRTVELYFVDARGRRMTFESATRYRDGKWRVDFMARVVLGLGPSEGRGLGGQPGRWREFYPQKSPGDCGFVENVGVLCWEDGDGRAHATEAGLLSAALGPDWRTRLKQEVATRFGEG